jgi:hypothetical protein
MDATALKNQILRNPDLKSSKQKAAAIYGAITALAFIDRVEDAKALAATCGNKFP